MIKQNLYTFSLFFFLNTYNFSILKNCRRKTIWVVLIFDGFSIFRFLSLFFTGEWVFPEVGWIRYVVLTLASVQTEDSLSNFSNAWWPFWREDPVNQSSDFSSSTSTPSHATWLTKTSFVQQIKGHRVQIACPFSLQF